MARTPKKNFLFTEEDVVPPELLSQVLGPKTPQRNIGEGDDSDVANPDVPGSKPRHPHPKPDGDPTPDPRPDDPDEERGDTGNSGSNAPDPAADNRPRRSSSHTPGDGDISRQVRYEGRIRIVDAWQYNGNLKAAPDYVDRNWAAYGDFDPVRLIEPGPALRVPSTDGGNVMCRPGDYVVTQEVRLTPDDPGDIRVEVWEQQQFERLFLPVERSEDRVFLPVGVERR